MRWAQRNTRTHGYPPRGLVLTCVCVCVYVCVCVCVCVAHPPQKCAEYWPEDTVTHEGIKIKVVTVTQEDDYSLRVFSLKVRSSGARLLAHHTLQTQERFAHLLLSVNKGKDFFSF